jgi:energy-converting hydrogenase A subunit R
MPQLNIDCEGPITQNDNAFEFCEEIIPAGGEFFARVSRYDDYLADVEKRPGYKAGDTLKLVLPFLKAFGATEAAMRMFSEETLVLLPGAREMLSHVAGLMPTFIISTSYRPYLDALCGLSGFPRDQVYCTQLDLDQYGITEGERKRLAELARELASWPLLSWPSGAEGRDDLAPQDREMVRRLDAIFWEEIPGMAIGRVLKDVNPVGGSEKARAVEDSLTRTDLSLSEVFYVGDSITDVQALELVNGAGGVALSFNGNSYALKAAKWACLSGTTAIIAALAGALLSQDMGALDRLIASRAPRGSLEGVKLVDALREEGVERSLLDPLHGLNAQDAPRLFLLSPANLSTVIRESEQMRRSVRGLRVGGLG